MASRLSSHICKCFGTIYFAVKQLQQQAKSSSIYICIYISLSDACATSMQTPTQYVHSAYSRLIMTAFQCRYGWSNGRYLKRTLVRHIHTRISSSVPEIIYAISVSHPVTTIIFRYWAKETLVTTTKRGSLLRNIEHRGLSLEFVDSCERTAISHNSGAHLWICKEWLQI